jgi:hypothetical protein
VLIDILFGLNAVDVKNTKRFNQPKHHCIGEMYNIFTISPENIAYAAVVVCIGLSWYDQFSLSTHNQARFCISSKKTWSFNDNNFSYRTFYQAILGIFVDDDDPWVRDTLVWWNE